MTSSTVSMKRSHLLRWLERALLLAAVICLGIWAWSWLDAAYFQYLNDKGQGKRKE